MDTGMHRSGLGFTVLGVEPLPSRWTTPARSVSGTRVDTVGVGTGPNRDSRKPCRDPSPYSLPSQVIGSGRLGHPVLAGRLPSTRTPSSLHGSVVRTGTPTSWTRPLPCMDGGVPRWSVSLGCPTVEFGLGFVQYYRMSVVPRLIYYWGVVTLIHCRHRPRPTPRVSEGCVRSRLVLRSLDENPSLGPGTPKRGYGSSRRGPCGSGQRTRSRCRGECGTGSGRCWSVSDLSCVGPRG